jgi:hypothetical protein
LQKGFFSDDDAAARLPEVYNMLLKLTTLDSIHLDHKDTTLPREVSCLSALTRLTDVAIVAEESEPFLYDAITRQHLYMDFENNIPLTVSPQ